MSWNPRLGRLSFDKARRAETYRRFTRAVSKEGDRSPLLPLDEVRDRLGLFEQTYVGIHPIKVDRVVGSADQNRDFDRSWRPLREDVRDRWERVARAFPTGDFPPIVVYEVDEAYFVVDGHHRVSVARHQGVEMIDAEITRLHTQFDLPADADVGTLILRELERIFLDRSGLGEARPGARISISRAHGYLELLELVEVHGYHLSLELERVVPPAEAAANWYANLYLPTIETVRSEGLDALTDAPDGDLFLWVYSRHRTLFPGRRDVTLEQAAKEAGAEERSKTERHRKG